MQARWVQWGRRLRGFVTGPVPMNGGGAAALSIDSARNRGVHRVESDRSAPTPARGVAAAGGEAMSNGKRRWGWLWFRSAKPDATNAAPIIAEARDADAPDAAQRLDAAIERLDRVCTLFERQVAAQQSASREILTAIREQRAADATSAAPALSAEQWDQLHEVLRAQSSDTQKVAEALREVPGLLRGTQQAVSVQGELLSEQRRALAELNEHARAAAHHQADGRARLEGIEQRQGETLVVVQASRSRVDQLTASTEGQAAALSTLVTERRAAEHELTGRLELQARRLSRLVNIAIGTAAFAAGLGALQLFMLLVK